MEDADAMSAIEALCDRPDDVPQAAFVEPPPSFSIRDSDCRLRNP